jgi:GON domain
MRALAAFFFVAMATCAAGCPALLSDDFVIRADGGADERDSAASTATDGAFGDALSDATIGDGGAEGEPSGPDTADSQPVLPRSCKDIHDAGVVADGTYMIDIDGPGPAPPFAVYCYRMATVEPLEYLELPANVEAGVPDGNFSGFATLCTAYPSLTVAFLKVRLDIQSLRIDRSDLTFAYVEGDGGPAAAFDGNAPIMYASAGSCVRGGDTSGQGNADLTGTPFRMTADTMFVPAGYNAACTAVFSPDRKRVDLRGGGYAGWCDVEADAGGIGVEFAP